MKDDYPRSSIAASIAASLKRGYQDDHPRATVEASIGTLVEEGVTPCHLLTSAQRPSTPRALFNAAGGRNNNNKPFTWILEADHEGGPREGHWSIWYQILVAEAGDSLTR